MKTNTKQITLTFHQEDDEDQATFFTVLFSMGVPSMSAQDAENVPSVSPSPESASTIKAGAPGAKVKVSEPKREVTRYPEPRPGVKLIFPKRGK